MLELARQDPTVPYAGGASTFYRFVGRLRAELEAGAAPVIRFEGLPGEYVQWDWGEARVRLGGTVVKRVFLAGRLKYSRLSAVRWQAEGKGSPYLFENRHGPPRGSARFASNCDEAPT